MNENYDLITVLILLLPTGAEYILCEHHVYSKNYSTLLIFPLVFFLKICEWLDTNICLLCHIFKYFSTVFSKRRFPQLFWV